MRNKKNQDKNSDLRAQLRRYQSAVNELQLMNEIAIVSGNAVNVEEALNNIIQKILKAFNAEQCSIMLLTENERDPFTTYLRQTDFSNLKPHYHINSEISGWILKNEEAVLIKNLSKDKRFISTDEERNYIRSLLCTPVWFEGNIIGLMTITNKKDMSEFTEDDLTLLSIISVQTGQLIKNSQLRQEYFQKTKEAELSRWESDRLRELDTVKTNFFTNLSHEFRTPLMLILGPLRDLLDGKPRGDTSSQYLLMYNHASRLLQLVNQLLDLSSIDAGKMKLEIRKSDLLTLIKGIISSFQYSAEEKDISLNFNSEIETLEGFFDHDKFEKIISNLLSNAVKFNKKNGIVNVVLSEIKDKDYVFVEIKIEDNGPGMSSDFQKNVFNRFFKSTGSSDIEGSGIGLSLVKELVELHFGEITFESTPGIGTKFRIMLPVSRNFYENRKIIAEAVKDQETIGIESNAGKMFPDSILSEDKPPVVVIEDNKDMRSFIKESLAADYKVIESSDGEDGLCKILEQTPAIIISDLIIPKINGLELCMRIKNDERISHVPVILLTSKAESGSKLRGLEAGADDYIIKPFNVAELLARMKNLIEQRNKLREKFRKQITLEPKNITITSTDEKFINRIVQIVEQNIGNENFSAEDFAAEAGMSKTHLNRKLNAIAGTSANEFIRTYRLKKSLLLLAGKSGNIAEIAYEVGFSNPSYFAESFKKLFGYSPSEFLQNPDLRLINP